MKAARFESAPFLAPAAALLAVVTAVPMAYVVWLSLEVRTPFRAPAFAGLDNYLRLASDGRFWNALWNTAYFTAASVALELMLGLAVALAVARAGRTRALVYAAILVPWAIPTVVSARMWEWMYSPETGVLNYLLGARVNWLGDRRALRRDRDGRVEVDPFVALLPSRFAGILRDLYRAAATMRARTASGA
jgi:multiple sugar transport system permease protein